MNISFTKKQSQYIADQIETGDFQNASEVVRDALRLHEVYRLRIMDDIRSEIAKTWNNSPQSQSGDITISIKLPEKLKAESEHILTSLGLSQEQAIEIFLKQVLHHKGLPFPLNLSKQETNE